MGFWLFSMFSISFHTCLLASSSSSWPFTFFWVCSVAIFRHILDWLIVYHPIQKKKEFKENLKKILSCLSPVLTQEKSWCYNEHMKKRMQVFSQWFDRSLFFTEKQFSSQDTLFATLLSLHQLTFALLQNSHQGLQEGDQAGTFVIAPELLSLFSPPAVSSYMIK